MPKKHARRTPPAKTGPVWKLSADEATLAGKPRYNGYACKAGPHGDAKYNRAKSKRAWEKQLGREGASRGPFLFARAVRCAPCLARVRFVPRVALRAPCLARVNLVHWSFAGSSPSNRRGQYDGAGLSGSLVESCFVCAAFSWAVGNLKCNPNADMARAFACPSR